MIASAPSVEIATQLDPAPPIVRLASAFTRHLPIGRYRAAALISGWFPTAFLMRLPKALGRYSYICDLRDAISREVCFTGQYEPQETIVVRNILRPGMTFVDVGANWGYFTLLGAELVGKSGRVIAIEPDPRLFPILEANVRRNGLVQVTTRQMAAAAEQGSVTLTGYVETDGNFGVSRIEIGADTGGILFRVASDSLDRMIDETEIPSIDLMKMDIEGGEAFAIPGLQESLAKRRLKRLLLELHPSLLERNNSTVRAIQDNLSTHGYSCLVVDHSATATRRAAYGRLKHINDIMKPLVNDEFDAWPHQLWLAPGIPFQ